ncbi:hypothetical protein [Pseudomonas putida]|uniref:Uncharacterized protein n=1 Tax=Pseudomonas putida TaxID=303 RepID=A0A2S3WBS8_PSEPU|nr:hypothetical protein [Pseudomonas putida]POF88361.1 hypothetical protein BGP80_10455 [Pseudomonas putida]
MPRNRLTLAQERLLWEIALNHFGPEQLLQIVVELWDALEFPQRTAVDHLSTATLSAQVLNILNIAQIRVGAFVPLRETVPGTVTMYSRHASDLADGLLARLPVMQLTRELRGNRLDDDMGM